MLEDAPLFQTPLGEGQLFDVLGRWYHADPPAALLWEAAMLYEGASPAMLQGAARWLAVAQELRDAGVDDGVVARVFLSATAGEPPGWVPPGPVIAQVLARAGDAIDPAAIADELLAKEELSNPLRVLLTICSARLAERGREIPPSHDDFIVFHVPWADLRAVIAALPEPRRDAVLTRLIGKPINDNGARVQLRYALPILDLATGPGAKAALEHTRKLLEGQPQWASLLAEAEAGGGPPPARTEPTEECRNAVQYWLDKYSAKDRVASIGDVARETWGRSVTVDAPELLSFAAWNAASDERRRAIAEQIAGQVEGLVLHELSSFDAGPIATFTCGEIVLRLVPGGSYDRGFSDEEEAVVRAEGEVRRPADDNWFEEFGHFLDHRLPSMRPVSRVTVGPLLVCASPGYTMEPDAVAQFLRDEPWRLPSEAEWEYLARGGREHELTWRGNTVPDEEWFEQTNEAGESEPNPFGLWGFGLQPEICADGWFPSHDDAHADATPRWGTGPRVTRGGAAMLYPWQQVGEWQLLCNAMRARATEWEFELNVRPVLGVTIGKG